MFMILDAIHFPHPMWLHCRKELCIIKPMEAQCDTYDSENNSSLFEIKILGNKTKWIMNQYWSIFIQKRVFENVTCKMVTIFLILIWLDHTFFKTDFWKFAQKRKLRELMGVRIMQALWFAQSIPASRLEGSIWLHQLLYLLLIYLSA